MEGLGASNLERVDGLAEVLGGEEGGHVGGVSGDGDEDEEGEAGSQDPLGHGHRGKVCATLHDGAFKINTTINITSTSASA